METIITPLGTVSPYCKNDTNCPGFLLENGDEKLLLDCGNGITRLMQMPKDLDNLVIIISHLHKDHYADLTSLGYASFVYKNLGYLKNKIKVYIPKGDYIKEQESYLDSDGWGCSKEVMNPIQDFIYLTNFGKENYLEFIPYNQQTEIVHGKMKVNFSKNPHPLITYSIRVNDGENTIVYSADTGYNENSLVKFANNCDLLICESSFLRGQMKREDHHLYAYEAGLIARDAKAKKLLLTHFWPEIEKSQYVEEAKNYFENTEASYEGKKLVLRGRNG